MTGQDPTSRRAIAAVLVAALVVPVGTVADELMERSTASALAGDGAIVGTVRLGQVDEDPPTRLSPYSRGRYRAPSSQPRTSGVEDVVLYVLNEAGGSSRTDTVVTLSQANQRIRPHVTAIQTGTDIDFPNDDDIYHNLFSLSSAKSFDLGRYPPGESRSVTFDRAGEVRLFCDIHSEMSAVILVLDTPWFARPASDGSYRIEGLPPGRHTVVAWHERLPPDSVIVEVPATGAVEADFFVGG